MSSILSIPIMLIGINGGYFPAICRVCLLLVCSLKSLLLEWLAKTAGETSVHGVKGTLWILNDLATHSTPTQFWVVSSINIINDWSSKLLIWNILTDLFQFKASLFVILTLIAFKKSYWIFEACKILLINLLSFLLGSVITSAIGC